MNENGERDIESHAAAIRNQYTRQKLADELKEKNFYKMGLYVHKYAVTHAYKDITENTRPSDNYKSSRFEVCKQLIALAGYRLADLLNEYLH